MKLWLDDQIGDPETPDRHTPPGYTGVSTALQACRLIRNNRVTHIDFDHDLGVGPTGYTVARFIEKRSFLGVQGPMSYDIHSANPVGRANIERAMKSAGRFWRLSILSATASQLLSPDETGHGEKLGVVMDTVQISTEDYHRYDRGLYEACESLHGALKGSCDPLPDAEKARLLAFLHMRLDGWEPTIVGTGSYDAAMRLLIVATLAEQEGR